MGGVGSMHWCVDRLCAVITRQFYSSFHHLGSVSSSNQYAARSPPSSASELRVLWRTAPSLASERRRVLALREHLDGY